MRKSKHTSIWRIGRTRFTKALRVKISRGAPLEVQNGTQQDLNKTIDLLNFGGNKIVYILKMGGFWNETQQDLNKMVDMVKFWGAKRLSRCRKWGAKPRRIPTDSQKRECPPGGPSWGPWNLAGWGMSNVYWPKTRGPHVKTCCESPWVPSMAAHVRPMRVLIGHLWGPCRRAHGIILLSGYIITQKPQTVK